MASYVIVCGRYIAGPVVDLGEAMAKAAELEGHVFPLWPIDGPPPVEDQQRSVELVVIP